MLTRFEHIFDRIAEAEGLQFTKEEKPVVGLLVPGFINRRGAAHIHLRTSESDSVGRQLQEVFYKSLQAFGQYTTAYRAVVPVDQEKTTVDLLEVPSLKRVVEALGVRATLQVVQTTPQEEIVLDYPVQVLAAEPVRTNPRKFSDDNGLIG